MNIKSTKSNVAFFHKKYVDKYNVQLIKTRLIPNNYLNGCTDIQNNTNIFELQIKLLENDETLRIFL